MNNSDIYQIDELKEMVEIKIDEILMETDKLTEEEQINYLIMLHKSFESLQRIAQKDIKNIHEVSKNN